jgi:hypothetical protein
MTVSNSAAAKSSIWSAVFLLAAVLAINVIFMPGEVWHSDAGRWRCEAASILYYGRLWIDPRIALHVGQRGQYFVFNSASGHWYSKYGIVNSLISIPPMSIEWAITGRISSPWQPNLIIFTLWNFFLSLLLALVLFVITGRYATRQATRILYVLACFFATYLWFYQRAQGSGEIYQAIFFAAAYECLLRGLWPMGKAQPRWLASAWLFIGLLVLTRVLFATMIPVAIGVTFAATHARRLEWRKVLPATLLAPALILALLGWINDVKFGSPFLSGYHQWFPDRHLPIGFMADGVLGMLFSVRWSIFVYFPVLLFALPGLKRFASAYPLDAALIGSMFLITLLVLGKIHWWRGEWTYGPRYMLFLLPIAALPALCFADRLIGMPRSAAACAAGALAIGVLGYSCWLQFEVNRTTFFFSYLAEIPLEGHMDAEVAEYFLDRNEAILILDLSRHRQDLDQTTLFQELRAQKLLTPMEIESYRQTLLGLLDRGNLYWWPSRTP